MIKLRKWEFIALKALYMLDSLKHDSLFKIDEICKFIEKTESIVNINSIYVSNGLKKISDRGLVILNFSAVAGNRYQISHLGRKYIDEHMKHGDEDRKKIIICKTVSLSRYESVALNALYAMEFNDYGRYYDIDEICAFIKNNFISPYKKHNILNAICKMCLFGFVVFKSRESDSGEQCYRISIQGSAFAKEYII